MRGSENLGMIEGVENVGGAACLPWAPPWPGQECRWRSFFCIVCTKNPSALDSWIGVWGLQVQIMHILHGVARRGLRVQGHKLKHRVRPRAGAIKEF